MYFSPSFLLLLLHLSTTTLTFSSQPPPPPPPPPQPPVIFPIIHTLSHTPSSSSFSSSPTHLLHSSSLRSTSRFHRRHHRHHRSLSLPLSPGSDYTLSLSLLSHEATLFLDTGSDLVWLPCHPFLCILCEGKPKPTSPPLNISLTLPLPCSSPSCSAAHSSLPSRDLCAISGCRLDAIETSSCDLISSPCPPFYYAYGDGSLTAHLRTAHLAFPHHPRLHLPNFTFGCSHSALAEPMGVAGFGRGPLSLPAQLSHVSPHLGKQFSYCLVSHSFDAARLRRPSPLILGRGSLHPEETSPAVYTPMLDDPKHPYYYSVALEAVSVGRRRVEAPPSMRGVDAEGNGGFVVDSGTTFTMLPREMFEQFAAEFDAGMRAAGFRRAEEMEEETGLGPCYHHHHHHQHHHEDEKVGCGSGMAGVPRVAMHFGGNATVRLRRRNYYYYYDEHVGMERGKRRRVGCLTVMGTPVVEEDEGEGGGPAGTMGNVQQQGMEVVFDLEGRRVGFARKSCGSLWGRLARGTRT